MAWQEQNAVAAATKQPLAESQGRMTCGHPLLCERIVQRILDHPDQRISFAEFMELALYDAQFGYYVANPAIIGAAGDFVTAPHLGADFGELLAVQFAEMWQQLGHPRPFALVEMGAGQGLIVQDVLRYLHRHHFECFEALEYSIIEQSPALVALQKQRLQKLAESWGQLHWRTWEEIAADSLVGCCFSNELVDAFPVHLLEWSGSQLQEVYVTVAGAAGQTEGDRPSTPAFQEILGDLSTPALSDYFILNQVAFPSPAHPAGYRTEVNLAALDWLSTVANRLQRGYVLTLDYGYSAPRYYHPVRSQGTLQCYFQHAHHNDPYLHIGQQDITAHVDFTALERQGDRCGLETLGCTQQGLFLMALGMGDRIAALSQSNAETPQDVLAVLRRREALHALINPIGMGGFSVLVQGKGLQTPQRELRGLSTPSG